MYTELRSLGASVRTSVRLSSSGCRGGGGRSENAPDGRARSAGVSRNWSVLYVSYLGVTLAEGVYKLYVVYRRQRKRSREVLGTKGRGGGRTTGTAATTSDVGNCCCSRYPYDSAANQRIRSSGSRRLSACPPEAEAIRFRRFPRRRRARSQPAQRLTNRRRLSATRAEFRAVSSIAFTVSLSPPFSPSSDVPNPNYVDA